VILGSVFAGLDPHASYATVSELRNALRNNLSKAVTELDGSAIGDPLIVATMQHTLGVSLMGLGEYPQAITVLEKAALARKARLGPDHLDTLASNYQLAQTHLASGTCDRALPLSAETYTRRKARLGPDHPDTLSSMCQLAWLYSVTKKFDQGIPLAEEALRRRQAKLGPDHIDTLGNMGELAEAYAMIGKPDLALPLLDEVIKVQRAKLGHDHPDTIGAMVKMSRFLLAAKEHVAGEGLLREVLALREKAQPGNWLTFYTRSLLGGALLGQQKYTEADPLLVSGYEGMKLQEKMIPGQGASCIPAALDRLIELYTAMSRPDEVKKWQTERAKYPAAKPARNDPK
jgi:tetratricopeptide (TPR) repeat protein